MDLAPRQREVLHILCDGDKNKQKREIAKEIDSSPDYVARVLIDLKKLGLAQIVNARFGWWKPTEEGIQVDAGKDIDPPFFTEAEVSSNPLLCNMSHNGDVFKPAVQELNDEILQFLVGLYLIKKDMPIPVGRKIRDEEWFIINKVTNELMQSISETQSHFYTQKKAQ